MAKLSMPFIHNPTPANVSSLLIAALLTVASAATSVGLLIFGAVCFAPLLLFARGASSGGYAALRR